VIVAISIFILPSLWEAKISNKRKGLVVVEAGWFLEETNPI
jgi:hypothetical protein